MRHFLGTFATEVAAAEAADLGSMLFVGGSAAAAGRLNLDWDGVSEEQLRAKQAPVLQRLLDKLQGTPGPEAAKLVKTLQDKNAGLLQQQQEQQRQTSAGQQQRRQQRQSTTQRPPPPQQQQQQQQPQQQQQQQQQQSCPAGQQQQQSCPAGQQQQQSCPAGQQQHGAAAQQAQAQGGEPGTPQPGPAPLLRIVLELPEEAGQQVVATLQSVATAFQQAASSVQRMFSGAKRSAEGAPSAAEAPRRRLRL
jgi:hypothetical protein